LDLYDGILSIQNRQSISAYYDFLCNHIASYSIAMDDQQEEGAL